jgi:hypothetical protein
LHTKDDNDSRYPCPSSIVEHQDALKLINNAQKTLQEWNIRWGTIAKISFQTTSWDVGLSKVPVDSAHGELMTLVTKGNEMLKELESIPIVELESIRANAWQEVFHLVEGITERIVYTTATLLSHIDIQSHTT